MKTLFTVLWLAGTASAAEGSPAVFAALSSDSSHYRQAFEGFQDEWGSSVTVIATPTDLRGKKSPIVATFGAKATMEKWPDDALIIDCLSPGAQKSRRGETIKVALTPSPGILIDRLLKLLPRLKKLRVFWSSEIQADEVNRLSVAGAVYGIQILSQRIFPPDELPGELRRETIREDALWIMPDPLLVNALNFAILKEYAAARRVPFFAPTEGLVEKGATATISVPFPELGRAAAKALRARLNGEEPPEYVSSEKVVVTVSVSGAAATGLVVSPSAQVDRQIP